MELILLNTYLHSLDVVKMRIHFGQVSTQQGKTYRVFKSAAGAPVLVYSLASWALGA